MQIGGLGLITMTLFVLSLFTELGLGTQIMAGQILELTTWKNIRHILLFIIAMTIGIELVGALLFAPIFVPIYGYQEGFFLALFHAVSSFCSAGITIGNTAMPHYVHNQPMIFLTTLLMAIGGLGFITWYELAEYMQARYQQRRKRLSLQSKITLYGSGSLFLISAVLFWILEHDHLLAGMSALQTINTVLFHAISFKSSGFLLFNCNQFQLATLVLIMVISFIGSSPGSTGSGVKITTFTIFFTMIKQAIVGKTTVEIRGRRIPLEQVFKAAAIVSLGLVFVVAILFFLLITEQQWLFIDILMEAMGAFSNSGISTGITAALSSLGKIAIMITMLIGRIGSVTLVLALKLRTVKETTEFSYPEERVMLG